jgi:choline dehydrogenase-like flavoprotein
MRTELISTLAPDSVTRADICIVGSGPAGLVLAEELSRVGRRILVLESGDLEPTAEADALSEITSVGAPRVLDQALVRNRVFGGTSSTWSGRVATFDRMDFAERAWIPGSGWPITRSDLTPYGARARAYLMAPLTDNNDPAEVRRYLATQPGYDRDHLISYLWSFSTDPVNRGDFMRFGPRALRQRIPGVTCFLGATVTHLNTTPDGAAVESVEVTGPEGRRRLVRSDIVVLCAGGIENARLLLASNRIHRAGVGNVHDQVGRYLMDHPRGRVGNFADPDFGVVQKQFASYRVRQNGRTCVLVPGVALSETAQRVHGLANCAAWTTAVVSPEDPWNAAAELGRGRGRPVKQLQRIARGAGVLASSVTPLLVDRRSPPRRLVDLELECMVEQPPDPDSRVTLDANTDRYGVPLSRIDWRVGEIERRTVQRVTELIAMEFARVGLPIPRFDRDVFAGSMLRLPDVAHPTGTTRMSASPRTGVVDRDCQVHGVRGLYIAGSSVFPTSGHANPTQTIIQLAIRLADHLNSRRARGGPAGGEPAADPDTEMRHSSVLPK